MVMIYIYFIKKFKMLDKILALVKDLTRKPDTNYSTRK